MTRTGLGSKVFLAFGLLMAVILALGLAALSQADRVNGLSEHIRGSRLPKTELARTALRYSNENNRITMEIFLLDDRQAIQRLLISRADNTGTISKLHESISKLLDSPEERKLFAAVRAARNPYVASYLKALGLLLDTKDPNQARRIMVTETLPLLRAYHAAMGRFVDFENAQMAEESVRVTRGSLVARSRITVLIAIALVAALAIGSAMTAATLREMRQRTLAEQQLLASHGALEKRVRERTADLARLNEALESDVARRKRMEADLDASVARYRLLFDRTLYGVVSNRMDGLVDDCNESAARLLGLASRSELIGRNIVDFYMDPARRAEVVKGLQDNEAGSLQEIEFRKKDGSPLWALVNLVTVRDQGREDCRIEGVFIDVTGRKQLEEQFLQAQKMEAVGRLAGGVAHDFNNLLTVILGFTGVALEAKDLPAPAEEALAEVYRAGERASTLTRQLLAFSRKQVLVPEILDIGAVVRDAEKMLRRLIGEDIALTTAVETSVAAVRADRGQIEQVIMNLVVNARDAMPEGGRLSISARNVEIDDEFVRGHRGSRKGPHVMIAIRDTGIGMDASTRSHLFEPFFTTKEKGKGTGLGLATVYGIVKQSGGYIGVESESGRGTEFGIFLPSTVDARASAAPLPGAPSLANRAGTILLVEDEDVVRRLVQTLLERAGYITVTARNGDEALIRAREHEGRIDLVLTDVVMPGMSGPDLTRRFAAEGRAIRTLYMSGYAGSARVESVLDSGNQLIQKPFTSALLLQRVREALDRPAAVPVH